MAIIKTSPRASEFPAQTVCWPCKRFIIRGCLSSNSRYPILIYWIFLGHLWHFDKKTNALGSTQVTGLSMHAHVHVCMHARASLSLYMYGTVHNKLDQITVRWTSVFKHGRGIGPGYSYAIGMWWIFFAASYVRWFQYSWMTDRDRNWGHGHQITLGRWGPWLMSHTGSCRWWSTRKLLLLCSNPFYFFLPLQILENGMAEAPQ
jgi:hypothetical protein